MTALLPSAAVAYARRGLPVLPLAACGKRPLTAHGLHDATDDVAVVGRRWEQWPNANIAVATGHGQVVLDVDGEEGADALGALEREYGPLPATARALTGNGRHLWLRSPVDVRCSAGRLGPGLDVRGMGGYVVAPPSVHPCGRRYEWDRAYRGLEPAPAWLLDLLYDGRSERKSAAPVSPDTAGDLRAIAPAAFIPALTGLAVGRDEKVTCPFHRRSDGGLERTPSLHAYAHDWFCFGCQRGGSIIDFGAHLYGLTPRGRGYFSILSRLRRDLRGAA